VIDRRLCLVLALLTTAVAPIRMSMLDSASGPADAQAGEMGQTRAVQAATSTGRHGAYYLPQRHESRTLPLAILRLRALAEQEGFIVLAPANAL
jgi:poly(3-hydroxybutyrate) depolymerase